MSHFHSLGCVFISWLDYKLVLGKAARAEEERRPHTSWRREIMGCRMLPYYQSFQTMIAICEKPESWVNSSSWKTHDCMYVTILRILKCYHLNVRLGSCFALSFLADPPKFLYGWSSKSWWCGKYQELHSEERGDFVRLSWLNIPAVAEVRVQLDGPWKHGQGTITSRFLSSITMIRSSLI